MAEYAASAKLLLFGEHCAVYGFPAAGIPLADGICLQTADNPEKLILDSGLEKFRLQLNGFLEFITGRYECAAPCLDKQLTISGTAAVGSGFGSSAALCTVFARYLKDCCSGNIEGMTEWELANSLEQFFHGSASGIDTGLSSSTVPAAFYFKGDAIPERKMLPFPRFPIVYGAIPRQTSTKELVSIVGRLEKDKPQQTGKILGGLGKCTEDFIYLLKDDEITSTEQALQTGRLCSTAQNLLKELGVSTDRLDSIIAAGLNAGACGGKLSGAGGGGAFWFAAEDKASAFRIQKQINKLINMPAQLILP